MFEKLARVLSLLPPAGWRLVSALFDAILKSDDPVEAVKRATKAAAAKEGYRAAARKALR